MKFLQDGPHGVQHPIDFQHASHHHLSSNEHQMRAHQYGPQQYPHNQHQHGHTHDHTHSQHQDVQREVQVNETLEIMGSTLLEEFKDIKVVNGELKYVKRED